MTDFDSGSPVQARGSRKSKFKVKLAASETEVDQCLSLRFDVFAGELGASLKASKGNLDHDRFDDHCMHLMVVDNETQDLVATTRLLTSEKSEQAGGFYSETEFDLGGILARPGRLMEVGRTCIHPQNRNGIALSLLWHGIAQEVIGQQINFLMGCASIPLSGGDRYLESVMRQLRHQHFSKPELRVRPRVPVPRVKTNDYEDVILPTLLKAYLRQGAVVYGEPYWDAEFGVADVFVMLDCERITRRYMRHFVDRISA